MTTYAVIMAGGSGSRFWPLSRAKRPKQVLPLGPSNEPLVAATVRRIASIVPPERVLVVTSALLADSIAEALPDVPRENLLLEPVGRNTAPCVGWAAARVARIDPTATLLVLPADHHIEDEVTFSNVLRAALEAAAEGELVTVGLTPTRPDTGFGYIEVGEPTKGLARRVARFVEKPDLARAEAFVRSGQFLWNSGMFFFRADAVLAAVAEHLPDLKTALDSFDAAAREGREDDVVRATFATLPNVSIDHGVMEKATRVAVVPGAFGWSDLGTWITAWELAEKDPAGNALPGIDQSVVIDASGNYVVTKRDKLVALVGVSDLVIVDTDDALLVLPRARAQEVRAIVDALKARGDGRL
jgi:mannose-1-phosphate guanylyltransferase